MQLVRRIGRPRHLSLTLLGSLLPLAALADTPVTLKNEVITATQTAHSEPSAPASVSKSELRTPAILRMPPP